MTDLDQREQARYERERTREERRLLRAEVAMATGRRDRVIGAVAGLAVVGAIGALMFLGGDKKQESDNSPLAGGFVTQTSAPSPTFSPTPSPEDTHTGQTTPPDNNGGGKGGGGNGGGGNGGNHNPQPTSTYTPPPPSGGGGGSSGGGGDGGGGGGKPDPKPDPKP